MGVFVKEPRFKARQPKALFNVNLLQFYQNAIDMECKIDKQSYIK
jgi:hypothetical protein